MASVFTANSSAVLIAGERVAGVRSIDFQHRRAQESVYALGSAERVAVVYGGTSVAGRLTIASGAAALDALLASGESFQVVANLSARADLTPERSVAFDGCFMTGKSFALTAGGHAEAVYEFTATRLREEAAA
jgi:hypothetical protein